MAMLLFASGTITNAQLGASSLKDPLVGKWWESVNGGAPVLIEFHENGAAGEITGRLAKWQSAQGAGGGRSYEVYWTDGQTVDYIRLSANALRYDGTNGGGMKLRGERVADLPQATAEQVTANLVAHIFDFEAPQAHYTAKREMDKDGTWHTLGGDYRQGVWSIAGNHLLMTVTKLGKPEVYTLPEAAASMLPGVVKMTGTGGNGNPVVMTSTDETPAKNKEKSEGPTLNYFGTRRAPGQP